MKISELLGQVYTMPMGDALNALTDNKDNIQKVAEIMKDMMYDFPNAESINMENFSEFQAYFKKLYEYL